MPSAQVRSYAKRSGKSVDEVEKIWNESKEQADQKFDTKDSAYWQYVSGVTKKRLGLKDEDEDASTG